MTIDKLSYNCSTTAYNKRISGFVPSALRSNLPPIAPQTSDTRRPLGQMVIKGDEQK